MRSTQETLALVQTAALALSGGKSARLTTLPGQASNRRYHRVRMDGGTPASLIVMELAPDAKAPEEVSAPVQTTELPFINVLRYLERGAIAVPALYRFDVAQGLLYLEDLGDTTLEEVVLAGAPDATRQHYRLAVADLVALQSYAAKPDVSCIAFERSFTYDLFLWELHHFREWLLEAERGVTLSGGERDVVYAEFEAIAKTLAHLPQGFVHRDYQSRNLMVQKGPRLRLLDFQDALLGPQTYDLVALLRDSYVELDPHLLRDLIDEYTRLAKINDSNEFVRLFHLQTVQRKLKDAGRFVFIDRVKHNPGFLPSIPASLRYVRNAFENLPELGALRKVLAHYVPEIG